MAHVHRVQTQSDQRGLLPPLFTAITEDFGQSPAPGTAGAPHQARGFDRREVRQAIKMLWVAGVAQRQLAQCLPGAVAHQPGGRNKAMQRPVIALKYLNAGGQPPQRLGFGQLVKLAFVGIDAPHKPFFWRTRLRLVVAMVVTVQGELIALGDTAVEQAPKIAVGGQVVMVMEVWHHQPSDGHVAQCIDGLDEGPVVGPGVRGHVVQYQHQRALSHGRASVHGCPARRSNAPAGCRLPCSTHNAARHGAEPEHPGVGCRY